ncbi:twin-arginine translocation signal domain-containing protein [Natronococcus amylolyticus]|uniref:twin-arginine translocation signal domain-containing protein n=1 Tax=Natronococcus amylolyticus TaxID=44470 RepID=UPI0012690519|nr:twin-arginine translocation signal domain-containing protein [Natronococcus amylolyticus]
MSNSSTKLETGIKTIPTASHRSGGLETRLSRRTFLRAGGTAAAVMALAGITTNPIAAQSQQEIYEGTAVTQVEYRDPYGQTQGAREYQFPARVVFDAPKSAGGVTENNPFSFYLFSADPGAEGALDLWSSYPAVDSADGREILFQYWELRTDGNELQGELTNSHTAEAAALNLINTETEIAPGISLPMPAAIVEGTALRGVFQDGSLSITVQGDVTSMNRPFICEVNATRQQ